MTVPHRRRILGMSCLLSWLAVASLAIVGATLAIAEQPASPTRSIGIDRLPPGVSISFNALEHDLFADAADGVLDTHSLLGAALTASGVDQLDTLERYQRQFDAWGRELRDSGQVAGSPRERAQAVFHFLHARVLRGEYRLRSTDLAETFDSGNFNCISATILFNCLCAQNGLKAVAVEGPGHAISRLTLEDRTLDVETTCPNWFEVLDDPAALAATTKHPPATRPLSPVALVGVIYYNRGVDLIERREFAGAMAANAKALRLDPANATAQGNLLAALNNWALDLNRHAQVEAAERLLHYGCEIAPYYAAFRTNLAAIQGQGAESP